MAADAAAALGSFGLMLFRDEDESYQARVPRSWRSSREAGGGKASAWWGRHGENGTIFAFWISRIMVHASVINGFFLF